MVVRCPYCVRLDDFMKMDAHGNGLYACAKCGRITIPESKNFLCSCRHCVALNFHSHIEQDLRSSA
jgi:DNA-directed RNA polymerase subunit RPC12/RpoP